MAADVPASSHDALVGEFCALTNTPCGTAHQREFAASFLEGHAWQLDSAVNAYLEMKAEEGYDGGAGGDGAANGMSNDEPTHHAANAEGQVRAPIPDKIEQLYEDPPEHMHSVMSLLMRQQSGGGGGNAFDLGPRTGRAGRASRMPIPVVDPFRNFADEMPTAAAAAAAAVSSGVGISRGGGKPSAQRAHAAKLSVLFQPPVDLIFVHPASRDPSFEAALTYAAQERKWLLINVQQADEFASHQLNRDVWNNKAIHELVRRHFIFCQPNHSTASGQRYIQLYHPPSTPTVAIIDPITRMKVWDIHQAGVGKEINTGNAAKTVELIKAALKEYARKTDLEVEHLEPRATMGSGANGRSQPRSAVDEEDRLLQAAINASLENSPHSSPVKPPKPAPAPAAASSRAGGAAGAAPSRVGPFSSLKSADYRASGSAASAPIELSDDDDDGGGGGAADQDQDGSGASETYVEISDSDGDYGGGIADEDDGSDEERPVTLPMRSSKPSPPSGGAPTSAAQPMVIDDEDDDDDARPAKAPPAAKRKRSSPIDLDSPDERECPANKAPRASEGSKAASSAAAAAAAAAASAAPAAESPSAPVVPAPLPASIPDEPPAGAPGACRLQIRLPGGKPVQRRFLKADPVRHVYAFTRSLLEADQRGKDFVLVTTMPRRELKDHEATIETSGVANASLILEWS